MLTDVTLKYPTNMLFLFVAVTAVVFFILAFRKKEKILAAFRLSDKAQHKATYAFPNTVPNKASNRAPNRVSSRAAHTMRHKVLRTILLGIGLGLMAVSLTGPQLFAGYTEVSKTGMDIYVLMDTSKSMLVADIAPDRMTIAKKIVGDLLAHLDGDRIGFIPFASDAYIQMPLTDDYPLARLFLDVMDTDMIGGGGTNLAAAISLANDSFENNAGADRVILILSDGEEHDEAALNALKHVTDEHVKVYTIGIGTAKGGLVPVYNEVGDTIIDYMKDQSGNPVTSRLHAETLKQLAQNGQGAYYQATLQGSETASLLADLSALNRAEYAAQSITRFTPLYQYLLGPGLLLFIIAWLWPERSVVA